MKYKDKCIKVGDAMYQVKYIDSAYVDGNWVYGKCDSGRKTIYISLKDIDGRSLKQYDIKLTLMHELLHAIYDNCCFYDISGNESAIEWAAKCLVQLDKQNFFNL